MEIQQEKQRLGVEMQQRVWPSFIFQNFFKVIIFGFAQIDQLQSALETADVERKQLIAKLDEEKR